MSVNPFYILCDASSSMSTEDVQAMNDGIAEVIELLTSDPIWNAKVRISIVTYSDNAEVLVPITAISNFTHLPLITIQSSTAQFGNLFRFMKFLLARDCRALSASYSKVMRPIVLHISKGRPSDERWLQYFERMIDKNFAFRPNIVSYGVRGADKQVLASIAYSGRSTNFLVMAEDANLSQAMMEIVRIGYSTDDLAPDDGEESKPTMEIPAGLKWNGDIVLDDLNSFGTD
jgi:uncharacterized protein YegL